MDLMNTARREHESIVAQLWVKRATYSAPPNQSIVDITPGDEYLVYWEKKEWDRIKTFHKGMED